MNKINLFIIIVVLFLLPSIYSYTTNDISTTILVRTNGSLEINEQLSITDFKDTNELVFDIFPVYDMIVKVNSKDASYTFGIDKLRINVDNYSTNEILLDITYLTDYYTLKDINGWTIDYSPLFLDATGQFKITFPAGSNIISLSTDIKNLHPDRDKFYVTDEDLLNFKANYKISNQNIKSEKGNNSWLIIVLVIILIGLTIAYFFVIKNKKNRKEKDIKKNTVDQTHKLLLGLNENEQKIIKLLLEEDGLSQQKIALKLFLPKGTVSRNIKKLGDKGYVDIKKYGVTNKAFLSSLFIRK